MHRRVCRPFPPRGRRDTGTDIGWLTREIESVCVCVHVCMCVSVCVCGGGGYVHVQPVCVCVCLRECKLLPNGGNK